MIKKDIENQSSDIRNKQQMKYQQERSIDVMLNSPKSPTGSINSNFPI